MQVLDVAWQSIANRCVNAVDAPIARLGDGVCSVVDIEAIVARSPHLRVGISRSIDDSRGDFGCTPYCPIGELDRQTLGLEVVALVNHLIACVEPYDEGE